MRNLLATLLSTLTLLSTYGAANGIDGEVLVKAGTTGNKALPSSQTTNVTISATSKVTDGASAVAFSLNSSNALSTSGAKLLTVGNGGNTVTLITFEGSIESGVGNPSGNNPGFNYIADTEVGGNPVWELTIQSLTNLSNHEGSWIEASGNASTRDGGLRVISGGPAYNDQINLSVSPDIANISISGQAGTLLSLDPHSADGTTPYTFDTSLAHTSGNLMEVKNNGTNTFGLAASGGLIIGHDFNTWISDSSGEIVNLTIGDKSANSSSSIFAEYIDSVTGTTIDNQVTLYTDSSTADFTIYSNGVKTKLQPTASDGTAVLISDTVITHTTGDLAQFKNSTTNYVTFQPDQAATNTPITININGTLKRVHVGAPDSGGTGLRALVVEN